MRERLQEYAPYISLFGIFLLLASPVVHYLASQEDQNIPEMLAPALAVVGLVLALAWPVLRTEEVREMAGSRRTRFGSNALILAVSVIGILVIVNFLGSMRYRIWDLTGSKQYSVSQQTVQVLDSLDEPVKLTAVVSYTYPRENIEDLEQLVDKYRQVSDKVSLDVIVREYDYAKFEALDERIEGAAPTNGLVAEAGDKHAVEFALTEEALTTSIIKATRDEDVTVYFTTGHGEHDPNTPSQDGRSYTAVRTPLEQIGYTVESFAITSTLPAANVIVVAGPQKAFLPQEAELLAEYVADGGALMVLADPLVDVGLEPVLEPWDISLQDDLVLDPGSPLSPNWATTVGEGYGFHDITEDLREFSTVLLNSRSIDSGTPVTTSLFASDLLNTADYAWGETDLEGLRDPETKAEKGDDDNSGPVTMGIAAQGGEDYGRLVVFGSSELVSDGVVQQFGALFANVGLFLNSVNWLADQEELITLPPKEADDYPLSPPENPILMLLLTTVAAPLVVLGIGTWVMWSRR